MRHQKGVDLDGRRGWDRARKSRGREAVIRLYDARKKSLFNKRKLNKMKGYTNFLLAGVNTAHLLYSFMIKSVGKVNFLYTTWNCIILVNILNSVHF